MFTYVSELESTDEFKNIRKSLKNFDYPETPDESVPKPFTDYFPKILVGALAGAGVILTIVKKSNKKKKAIMSAQTEGFDVNKTDEN